MSDPYWEYLERKGRLVTLGISEDEVAKRMRRVNGEQVCEICNKQYWQHPYITDSVDAFENRPYLHLLCNGVIAKL